MISKKQRGFTLIELLLVISIISLLASIVMSNLSDTRKKARVAVIQQSIQQVRNVANIYYTDRGFYTNTTQIIQGCPNSVNNAWGFLGTSDGIAIINNMITQAGGGTAKCAINPQSWAINIDTINLAANTTKTNVAYAQNTKTGFICFDSSNNISFDFKLSGGDGSDGGTRQEQITLSSGKYVCK
jgi:prepilin-type N-terminal cleavage/methylation domain-containing protein